MVSWIFAGPLACNLVAKAVLENPTGSSKAPAAMPRVLIAFSGSHREGFGQSKGGQRQREQIAGSIASW